MFYYLDIESENGIQRHILQPLENDAVMSFPLTDENPNRVAYDAWVAEGNTPKLWPPKKSKA